MIDTENRFVEAARKHGIATREGEPTIANNAHMDIVRALRGLRSASDKGIPFLKRQLNDADAAIVVWAALYLLPFEEELASEALQRVANQGFPRISRGAELTLNEWRSGRLDVE